MRKFSLANSNARLDLSDGLEISGNVTLGSNLFVGNRLVVDSQGNVAAESLPSISALKLTGTIPAALYTRESIPIGAVQGLSKTWFVNSNAAIFTTAANVGVGTQAPDPAFALHVQGIIASTSDVVTVSDARAKSDFEVIGSAMERMRRIRGYTFTKNDEPEPKQRRAGVVAQEVEGALPEAVITGADGRKSVAYQNLIALTIEAVRELDEKVQEINEKMRELDERTREIND